MSKISATVHSRGGTKYGNCSFTGFRVTSRTPRRVACCRLLRSSKALSISSQAIAHGSSAKVAEQGARTTGLKQVPLIWQGPPPRLEVQASQGEGSFIMQHIKSCRSWQALALTHDRYGSRMNMKHCSAMITHLTQLMVRDAKTAQQQQQQQQLWQQQPGWVQAVAGQAQAPSSSSQPHSDEDAHQARLLSNYSASTSTSTANGSSSAGARAPVSLSSSSSSSSSSSGTSSNGVAATSYLRTLNSSLVNGGSGEPSRTFHHSSSLPAHPQLSSPLNGTSWPSSPGAVQPRPLSPSTAPAQSSVAPLSPPSWQPQPQSHRQLSTLSPQPHTTPTPPQLHSGFSSPPQQSQQAQQPLRQPHQLSTPSPPTHNAPAPLQHPQQAQSHPHSLQHPQQPTPPPPPSHLPPTPAMVAGLGVGSGAAGAAAWWGPPSAHPLTAVGGSGGNGEGSMAKGGTQPAGAANDGAQWAARNAHPSAAAAAAAPAAAAAGGANRAGSALTAAAGATPQAGGSPVDIPVPPGAAKLLDALLMSMHTTLLNACSTRQLANTLWALSKLQYRPFPSWLFKSLTLCQKRLPFFEAQLSGRPSPPTANAAASHGHIDGRKSPLPATDIPGNHGHTDSSWNGSAETSVINGDRHSGGPGGSASSGTVLAAVDEQGWSGHPAPLIARPRHAWFVAILGPLHAQLPLLQPVGLATVLLSLSQLGVRPHRFLVASAAQSDAFAASETAQMLIGVAKMGYRPDQSFVQRTTSTLLQQQRQQRRAFGLLRGTYPSMPGADSWPAHTLTATAGRGDSDGSAGNTADTDSNHISSDRSDGKRESASQSVQLDSVQAGSADIGSADGVGDAGNGTRPSQTELQGGRQGGEINDRRRALRAARSWSSWSCWAVAWACARLEYSLGHRLQALLRATGAAAQQEESTLRERLAYYKAASDARAQQLQQAAAKGGWSGLHQVSEGAHLHFLQVCVPSNSSRQQQ
ncbi:hypothetical protein DUNSADRAFT_1217 [Dunaliella salina]|uniref:Uncharacterized protein n=1 Tax=Dunaliella salina TaxID=3046 RepID=A0ABQ7GXE3_DUNSA|nr:hypothetical protein DUNSADRAFT_1217 [Dunaliella salina]|eukprot:KAF5839273.1 hypothetical protein DUNSADRAFT_1217 [Dunaliella salina]